MKKNYEIYAYQIACIKTLEKHGLVTKQESEAFKQHVQKKYKVISGIGAYV